MTGIINNGRQEVWQGSWQPVEREGMFDVELAQETQTQGRA